MKPFKNKILQVHAEIPWLRVLWSSLSKNFQPCQKTGSNWFKPDQRGLKLETSVFFEVLSKLETGFMCVQANFNSDQDVLYVLH